MAPPRASRNCAWTRSCSFLAPELLGWRRQSAIENGYQRVDLIARLQPVRSAFWTTLSADFRARYVVFEFKNYTDPIGQDQIYATALRSVAIIIARNGYLLRTWKSGLLLVWWTPR